MTAALDASRTRWSLVLIGFFAGIVGMFQVAKMSVVLVDVQRDIGLTLVEASWSTTAVGLTGALFGVIAGRLTAEFGEVRTLVGALLLSAVSALGTAFLSDPALFFASRVVEGLGYLLICAAAPALMASSANGRDRGLALALWGAFVPVSVSLMSLAGPPVAAVFGWRVLFAASAATTLVAALPLVLLARFEPLGSGVLARLSALVKAAPGVHAGLYRSRTALGIGLAFLVFAALQIGLIALLPAYLVTAEGFTSADAGLVLSLITPFSIAGAALAGIILRAGLPDTTLIVAGFAGMALSGAAQFLVDGRFGPLVLAGAVFFTAGGVVASLIFAGLPRRTADAAGIALLSGLIVQFGNVGTLTGAPLLAGVAERFGWGMVPAALVAVTAIGILGATMMRGRL